MRRNGFAAVLDRHLRKRPIHEGQARLLYDQIDMTFFCPRHFTLKARGETMPMRRKWPANVPTMAAPMSPPSSSATDRGAPRLDHARTAATMPSAGRPSPTADSA